MSKMKLLSDWASGATVVTHSRFSDTSVPEICSVCGERFGNAMKKTYKYTIELKTEWWPRDLADKILMLNVFVGELLSIQDQQRADHLYAAHNTQPSDTFIVSPPDVERAVRSASDALDVIMAHLDTLLSPRELEAVRNFIGREILEKR